MIKIKQKSQLKYSMRLYKWCPKGCGKRVLFASNTKADKNYMKYVCQECGAVYTREQLNLPPSNSSYSKYSAQQKERSKLLRSL